MSDNRQNFAVVKQSCMYFTVIQLIWCKINVYRCMLVYKSLTLLYTHYVLELYMAGYSNTV